MPGSCTQTCRDLVCGISTSCADCSPRMLACFMCRLLTAHARMLHVPTAHRACSDEYYVVFVSRHAASCVLMKCGFHLSSSQSPLRSRTETHTNETANMNQNAPFMFRGTFIHGWFFYEHYVVQVFVFTSLVRHSLSLSVRVTVTSSCDAQWGVP